MAQNLKVKELSAVGVFKADQFCVLYDPVTGKEANKISTALMGASTAGNYNWDSTVAYNFGQIVTYNGKIWSSLVPGIESNQGNIPTESVFWTELARAPLGLTLWQAGVFLEDEVYKWRNKKIYALINPARPYNSTDIDAEILANDWEEWAVGIDHWKGAWNWPLGAWPVALLSGDQWYTSIDLTNPFIPAGTLLIAKINGASTENDYLIKL